MGRRKQKSLVLTTNACTAASVVNNATITLLQDIGSAYLADSPSPGSVLYYNATMKFMENIVLNLGFLEGSPLSIWDAVTAFILLGKSMQILSKQKIEHQYSNTHSLCPTTYVLSSTFPGVPIDQILVENLPLTISWTGRTVFSPREKVVAKCNYIAQVYNKMDPHLFFQQFVALIFTPLSKYNLLK